MSYSVLNRKLFSLFNHSFHNFVAFFVIDLGKSENVTRIKLIRFLRKHATGVSPIEMHTVHVERGMIWQEAIDK